MREALADPHPAALLQLASTILNLVDPRSTNPSSRDPEAPRRREEVMRSFLEVRLPETTGLLGVLAELTEDEVLAERLRREVRRRPHRVPAWITGLRGTSPYRATELVSPLADDNEIMIGVALPQAADMTVLAYIDHNLGTVLKDAFVSPTSLHEVLSEIEDKSGEEGRVEWRELDLAEARARMTQAIDMGARMLPPFESDTWPAVRPLVEWVMRLLPEGGRGYDFPEWDEAALQEVATRFLASRFADELREDKDAPHLVDNLLWYGGGYGLADPFHWSPTVVEILLLDWIPRKITADRPYLRKFPKALRAFIAFAHEERSVPAGITTETLAAVDRWEPEYLDLVGPSRQKRAREPASAAALEEMSDSLAIRRFDLLADFYGDGRKLTQTGNPTLADARELVGLLGTNDVLDPRFGDKTFRTRSADDLPELAFTIRWAIAAGALRKQHGRLRATASWRKLANDPARRWQKAIDAVLKLGPVVSYAPSRLGEVADEFLPALMAQLLREPVAYEAALDELARLAGRAFQWSGYLSEPESMRRVLGYDFDDQVKILGWAGMVRRTDASIAEDTFGLGRERLVGGTLALTDAGRWWITAPDLRD